MRVFPQNGAWYTDCLPSGEWVSVIFGSHIESSWGRINFLPGLTPTQNEPLFVRLNNDGTAFAGQSHGLPTPHPDNDKPVEYQTVTGEWAKIPKVTVGTNPVIYNGGNVLVIATAGDAPGSQGYGYVSQGGLFPAGQIVTGDQCIAPTAQVPGLWRWVEFAPGLFVGQGADENGINGGVLFYDGTKHRVLAKGRCRNIRARQEGDVVAIGYYEELEGGGYRGFPTFTTVAELKALPELVVPIPPPPDKFRPISQPLPKGTTLRNIERYFIPKPETMPRTGKHTIHWYTQGTRHFFCKFYDPSIGFHSKACYEEFHVGEKFLHQLTDRSQGKPHLKLPYLANLSNTCWFPRTMQIGEEFAWESGHHEMVEVNSETCQEFNRWGYTRRMGLLDAWDQFEAGRDFPNIPVTRFLYDPTGGMYAHDRHLEVGYQGLDVGPLVWESYRTAKDPVTGKPGCYDTGVLVLNEDTLAMRSVFYHKGGVPWEPQIAPCALSISPEEPPPMKIPLSIQTTMNAYASRFGQPPAGDGPIHDWSRRMAEQVKFSHGTPTAEWGLKSTSPGSPTSNNITLRDSTGIHTWDYIVGSAGPNPSLNIAGAEYFFIPNQHFISVQAIDHLGAAPPPSKFPPLALPFWGASGFDLAARVSAPVNDWRYYEELRRRKLKPRIQCYATIDHPATGRLYRDFGTGLAQLRVLLPRMAADGMQAQFVYLVGTTPDGVSRSEAINRIRQIDALVCQFPTVIAGRQGVNEVPYPGLEEPYTSDPGFWREVEAILDPRFPWTRYAHHGGQPVNMSGGSYFVHHSNRDLTPDDAGAILGAAQKLGRGNVVDDEPRRFEAGGSGQATGDLNFVRGLIANAKRHGYGLTLHNAAGRGCSVDLLSDLERQALDLMAAEVGTVIPPPQGHPILDFPLSVDTGKTYHWFIHNGDAILAEADAWYRRANGHGPSRTDIWHGLWQPINENKWWTSLRVAWSRPENEGGWPGGAP